MTNRDVSWNANWSLNTALHVCVCQGVMNILWYKYSFVSYSYYFVIQIYSDIHSHCFFIRIYSDIRLYPFFNTYKYIRITNLICALKSLRVNWLKLFKHRLIYKEFSPLPFLCFDFLLYYTSKIQQFHTIFLYSFLSIVLYKYICIIFV